MALIVDQQPNFKHFCKICKKGFMCGRALGGHMRAHGIGDESGHIDEDDPASDWEDKNGDNVPPGNKRMYALRTNPNRLKSCRICENCGKEFSSWKSFLEHGKCGSDDVESYVSSPESDDEDGMGGRKGCGWSKRKRSLRVKVADHNNNNNNNNNNSNNFNSNCPSSEEEDLAANCLMMLSNARTTAEPSMAEPEESCASASKEDQERRRPINFIAPLSCRPSPASDKAKGVASSRGLFECKACKKVFNSHQALGGHRASHKKVKGCFAARLDNVDDYAAEEDVITHEEFFATKPAAAGYSLGFDHAVHGSSGPAPSCSKRKSKVHECSICHRVFSSGQALGGHKRCHWITSNSPDASTSLVKLQHFHEHLEQIQQQQQQQQQQNKFLEPSDPLSLKLDLNLPAPTMTTKIDEHGGGGVGGEGGGVHRSISNPPGIGISPNIYLQTWLGLDAKDREHTNNNNNSCKINHQMDNDCGGQSHKHIDTNENNNNNNNNDSNNMTTPHHVVDDEADSKVKLAKLSELKDINLSGGSSSWLQVGIGSTADARAAK